MNTAGFVSAWIRKSRRPGVIKYRRRQFDQLWRVFNIRVDTLPDFTVARYHIWENAPSYWRHGPKDVVLIAFRLLL
ncbi:hypothetical protein VTN49DRAFT_4579 [Thermomyces lanuginosus]|uniref:uncharacterized protein n=1 Tax=Thermomyces lanuginosus TaxID=5541 RepID=UPI0037427FD7